MIRAGGAGAAGLTLFGAAGCDSDNEAAGKEVKLGRAPVGAMNVVVVVMDSLRADHIYGRGAQTPTWNKAFKESLRFTRAFPEAMPTIPARRSVMSGKRIYPVPRLASLQGPAAAARAGSRSAATAGCGRRCCEPTAGRPAT